MTTRQRAAFLAVAAVIAVAAGVLLTRTSNEPSPRASVPPPVAPTTTGSAPSSARSPAATASATATADPVFQLRAGSVRKIKVQQGDRVTVEARSSTATTMHIHGYDLQRKIPAGGRARVSFKATITGVFEIEFEESAEKIAALSVLP